MDTRAPKTEVRSNPRARRADGAASANPLGIIVDLLPPGFPTRPGTRIRPTTLTIHNTDNPGPGADAAAHNRYIRSPDAVARRVSWHFTVDDKDVYQHLPVNESGWHAHAAANASSIGIEICMHRGMDEMSAYDRAARLCVFLAMQLGITVPDGLRQHHDWTGKNCPSVLRGRPHGWQAFLERVGFYAKRGRAMAEVRFTAAPKSAPATRTMEIDGADSILASIAQHFSAHADAGPTAMQARPIPSADPIAFAASTATTAYWPVVTRHPRALEVNTLLVGGGASGANASRRFLAYRNGGTRFHCAIDLYCSEGDPVVALEDGRIVNFYHFYQNTYALLIQHDGYVVNYGEVAPNSLASLGLRVGDRVSAGQRIGTVGRLNMLHFETYASGTTRNYSWPKANPRPSRLRNPSQLLLDVAASAIRLDADQVVTPLKFSPSSGVQTVSVPPIDFAPTAIPPMDEKGWHSFGIGTREWRYDERGLATRENGTVKQQRWEESLDTMRKIMEHMGSELLVASDKHGIPPALLLMTVATETHIYKAHKFTGPKTFRWEAHVKNGDVNPPTLGDYSAGPMQSLGTTARWVIRSKGSQFGLDYDPFAVAPVYPAKPEPRPADHPLYEFATNLDLGAAEIRMRLGASGFDPIFVAAAFNAGGLYNSAHSRWGLRAYDDHLDRAAKWYGDACAYLIESGIV
ncbi:N-acetylmuramoyl-L-alanine amidase [Mesorhizobium sp. M0598]|uniref:N-acetylmuramoyl-L-alanine amidase n=1 Tax=Mesorhizobium sp. M0598 TaxID=2956968 RepID=UPI0033394810